MDDGKRGFHFEMKDIAILLTLPNIGRWLAEKKYIRGHFSSLLVTLHENIRGVSEASNWRKADDKKSRGEEFTAGY